MSPRRALRATIAGLAAASAVAVLCAAAVPGFASTTVAGHAVPVTEKTLADGYQLSVRIPPTAF